jgi:hypothetical protein
VTDLSTTQELKLRILAEGLAITDEARVWLSQAIGSTQLSSFDYASTSGLILKLEDDVWVNAPISDYNANFVNQPSTILYVANNQLYIRHKTQESRAWYCLQPAYHTAENNKEALSYVVTHGDRVRLSPMTGCSMACKFCNIPYEERYELKPIDKCLRYLHLAIDDPVQPAQHIMVSGGTPRMQDIFNHQELYRRILQEFPNIPVDIMMIPIGDILDLEELRLLGVSQLSINLEIYDLNQARALAPQKYRTGRDQYLDFIEKATEILGERRVRSMLMVGLEPLESTLAGVQAIAERGGIPVLSPFRPDPATPLKDIPPPGYALMSEIYLRAADITARLGSYVGPACPPCTHNTINFALAADNQVQYSHIQPLLLGKDAKNEQ